MTHLKFSPLRLFTFGFLVLALTGCASDDQSLRAPCPVPPVALKPGPEKKFATPQDAVEALADATRRNDKVELLRILGPLGAHIINSSDPEADQEGREKFLAAYDYSHKIQNRGDHDTLLIGEDDWPLPLPLIHVSDASRADGAWQFNTSAGEQEIINRRVGHNELNVIKIARGYVEAQRDYASYMASAYGRNEYAQHFISHAGKHDGLYWPSSDGQDESPLGPLMANAASEKYLVNQARNHQPYHGYYYKILTQQGDAAPGGSMSYLVDGHMTRGFALLAYPDSYDVTGVMTFIVDQNGIVYEKNLGPRTKSIARKITSYNPDNGWTIANDQ